MSNQRQELGYQEEMERVSPDGMVVEEAFEILNKLGFTKNIQVVRGWIRKGKLKGNEINGNYKEGYRITKEALDEFILHQSLRDRRADPDPFITAMEQLGYTEKQITEILKQTFKVVKEQKE